MAENIEIKAKAKNYSRQLQRASTLCKETGEKIEQTDIFFVVPKGRLKLRFLGKNQGELIYYERDNENKPHSSVYHRFFTSEPEVLKEILSLSLNVLGVVKKRRTLFKYGQTRLHFDKVKNLGEFIEIEYVLTTDRTRSEAFHVVKDLMSRLEIQEEDLIGIAYIDMLRTNL